METSPTNKKVIICLTHKVLYPDTSDIVQQLTNPNNTFNYRFMPAVIVSEYLYSQGVKEPKMSLSIAKPILSYSLFEAGVSFATLKSFFGSDFKRDELTIARKAFNILKSQAVPFAERIIADICSSQVLKYINNIDYQDCEIVIFLEKLTANKMLGRLSYLYLNQKNVTIAFLSYLPEELMSAVMSSQTGKLHFDLTRLINMDLDDPIGPYPSASEDGLEQTFFYKPRSIITDSKVYPIRFDLFSQGLTDVEVRDKAENIKLIMQNDQFSAPFQVSENYYVRLPYGFIETLERKNSLRNLELQDQINNHAYYKNI